MLSHPGPAKRLAVFNVTARQLLADYIEAADVVTPIFTPRNVPDDPDYGHVIAANHIRILRPADVLAIITQPPA